VQATKEGLILHYRSDRCKVSALVDPHVDGANTPKHKPCFSQRLELPQEGFISASIPNSKRIIFDRYIHSSQGERTVERLLTRQLWPEMDISPQDLEEQLRELKVQLRGAVPGQVGIHRRVARLEENIEAFDLRGR
jgi:hypothetical protein